MIPMVSLFERFDEDYSLDQAGLLKWSAVSLMPHYQNLGRGPSCCSPRRRGRSPRAAPASP